LNEISNGAAASWDLHVSTQVWVKSFPGEDKLVFGVEHGGLSIADDCLYVVNGLSLISGVINSVFGAVQFTKSR
jgi:hypothetical protein